MACWPRAVYRRKRSKDAHAGHGGVKLPHPADVAMKTDDGKMPMEMAMETEYPRTQPGLGGTVGSPTDRGKLVAYYLGLVVVNRE